MALCITVCYSYGKYMKVKVKTLQSMEKHAGQSNFTIKAYEIQAILNSVNKLCKTNLWLSMKSSRMTKVTADSVK